ncbi:MAG: hypothetical protein P1V34_09335 [Alphaproteobacteria bacterium]|nr:hypothetical protein [Alphaproteobacteria bacterium]
MTGLFDAVSNLGMSNPQESPHSEITDLYAFWLKGRNSKGYFPFQDFDIVNFPRHLVTKISLIKVHAKEMRFEFRIVGNDVIERSGSNFTGCFIDEMQGAEQAQRRLEFAVKNNLPFAAEVGMSWARHDFKHYGVGSVPLHDEDGNVVYILSVLRIYSGEKSEPANPFLNISSSNLPIESIEAFDQAFDFWTSLKGATTFPLKSAIDITRIPKLIPNLVLFEIVTNPLDFRYKLIGEQVREKLSPGTLGKTLRELPNKGPGSNIWTIYETVYETGIPRYGHLNYTGHDTDITDVLNLSLPFSSTGFDITHILSIIQMKVA